ncbi:MAG: SIMPL domain-containing protein [Ginsengibacter sp.]
MKKLFLLNGLLIFGIFLNAQNQMVSNPYPKTINVTGSAEMDVIPDEIYVQADLREYKKRGGDKMELETIKTNFLAACRSIGIEDSLISIASYEGNNYNYWRWKRKKDPDMYSSISYQVKFKESKKMDELIEKLDDEATGDFKIVRTSHSRLHEFKRQLKIEAVKQAKLKGLYLTEAIGEKLGEAITINEPDENSVYYYTLNKTSNAALKDNKMVDRNSMNENAAVDFKKIKLKYDVTILFALK